MKADDTSALFYNLYEEGVRLRLESGRLKVSRECGSLTSSQKRLISDNAEGLKEILEASATGEMWEQAVSVVARRVNAAGTGIEHRAVSLLEEADGAWKSYEDGLARYLLHRAMLSAREPEGRTV